MAQMAFAYGGAAIGSYFGPVGTAIGYAAGSLIGGLLFRPAGPHLENQGPRLTDLKVQAGTYGAPIAWVRGEFRLAGNIIWCRPIHEVVTVTEQQTGGGKGSPSGGTTQTTTYTYFGRLAIGICEGPRDIMKIFANGKLIYDQTTSVQQIGAIQPPYFRYGEDAITLYRGDEFQIADPFIESFEGAGNVPGYRGLCYAVFNDFPLADFGNSIPQFEFVTTIGLPWMTGVIYTDNAGTPDRLVAESEPVTVGESPIMVSLGVDPRFFAFTHIPWRGGFDWGSYYFLMDDAPLPAGDYWIGVVGDGCISVFGDNEHPFASSGAVTFQVATEVGLNVTCGAANNNWIEPDLRFLPAAELTFLPLQMKVRVKSDIPTTTGFSTLEEAGQNLALPHYITLSNGNLTCEGLARQGVVVPSITMPNGLVGAPAYARAIASEQKSNVETWGNLFYWEVHVDAAGDHSAILYWPGGAGSVGIEVSFGVDEISAYRPMNNEGANDDGLGGFLSILHPTRGVNMPGDTLMFALGFAAPIDALGRHTNGSNASLWVGRNGTWLNGVPTLPTDPDYEGSGWGNWPFASNFAGGEVAGSAGPFGQSNAYPACQPLEGDKFTFNFGATPFTYTPPDGAKLWTQEFKYFGTLNAVPPTDLTYDWAGLDYATNHQGTFIGVPDASHPFGTRRLNQRPYKGLTKLTLPDCSISQLQIDVINLSDFAIFGAGNTTNLFDHVSELLGKTILRPEDYDLTALAPYSVRGVGIARAQTVRQALRMLSDVCFFDLVESDGKLKAVIRGGHPIATITEGELAAVTGSLGAPQVKIDDKRVQDRDLPNRVIVNYQCALLDFQANAASAERLVATNSAKTIVTQDYSIALGTRKAHSLAEHLLWTMWAYRRQIQMTLPPRYIKYDAGDVVTVTVDGETKAIYLNSVEYGADNLVTMKGVINEALLVKDSLATGGERAGTLNFVRQTGTIVEQTDLLLFDAPLLRAVDDNYGFYVGAHGIAIPNGVWKGDTVYKLE